MTAWWLDNAIAALESDGATGGGWTPNPGPQAAFMACDAFEAWFGGSAGGGKTESLLMDATRDIKDPRYCGILFRRTFPELERSLIARSRTYYKRLDPTAEYNEQKKCWRFSSGATIYFGHLEHENDVEAHQSAEYQYIGFDEGSHFTEKQYRYMLSRARSSFGLTPRVRAGTNPGGRGHNWILKRFAPWLDRSPEYKGNRAESGETLYVLNTYEGEKYVDAGTEGALSRVFIRSRLSDNPYLLKNDPQYAQRLMGLDPVTRARLLDGDWSVREAAGQYFKREWFDIVGSLPMVGPAVRCWDFASTEPSDANPDPDWTCGVLVSLATDGFFYVEDVVRFRAGPGDVRARVRATAEADGSEVSIRIPRDPGQAGVDQVASYIQLLAGFNVIAEPVTGSKITRAGIASAQAHPASTGGQKGRVRLYAAPWVEAFIQELEEFPEGAHDDQVDPFGDAIKFLADGAGAPVEVGVTVIDANEAPRPKALPPAAGLPPALVMFVEHVRRAAALATRDSWARARSVHYHLDAAELPFETFLQMLDIAAERGVLAVRGEGNETEVRVD